MSTAASGSSLNNPITPSRPSLGSMTLPHFAWGVLGWNLLVIVWGAFVRASRSGDGCGSHWPFCNGQVIPAVSRWQTAVEFSHRISSGLALLGVCALCYWVYKTIEKGSQARRFAAWSVVFILVEAALGAGLVLFKLVAGDNSITRAIYLSAHLTNTLMLVGALTMTAWFTNHPGARIRFRSLPREVVVSLLLAILICVTGAIAALGDTLYPAISVATGIRDDFKSIAPVLLRLRLLHPVIAGLSGMAILVVALTIPRRIVSQPVRESAALIVLMILVQFALGAANVALLAPVWMQLVHLLASQLLWISLVLFTAEVGFSYQSPSKV